MHRELPEPVATPGSKQATIDGCTCPILDNSYGEGWYGSGKFIINETCPLHAKRMLPGEMYNED